MKRILLDENVPIGLVTLLDQDDLHHVHDLGWAGVSDADLIARATSAGFDVLVTCDQGLRFQQNIRGTALALVVVGTTRWASITKGHELIKAAVRDSRAGSSTVVSESGHGRRRRRGPP